MNLKKFLLYLLFGGPIILSLVLYIIIVISLNSPIMIEATYEKTVHTVSTSLRDRKWIIYYNGIVEFSETYSGIQGYRISSNTIKLDKNEIATLKESVNNISLEPKLEDTRWDAPLWHIKYYNENGDVITTYDGEGREKSMKDFVSLLYEIDT